MTSTQNLRVGGEGRYYDSIHVGEREWNCAVASALQATTAGDVLDELCDCEAQLQAAISTGNAELIGRMFLSVRQAYAERLANRALGTNFVTQSAEQAAREVLS